jgi:AcrR family transcriptional regulator
VARVVKDAVARRDELLATALQLFLERGYEHTSVEQITTAVGVAKGTFYHYFATKQDLLEQLVELFTADLFAVGEAAMAATNGSAVEKLRALMDASGRAKMGRVDETLTLTRSLYSEENIVLLGRLREGWIDRTRPLIRSIVDQGLAEGTFDAPDPAAITEVWLSLWYDFGIRVARLFFEAQDDPAAVEPLVGMMRALELAQERVLGLAPGSLDMRLEATLRQVLAAE